MKRGEVRWIEFRGSGGEIRHRRPAVIVSNDAANRYLNRVQVVPLTSRIDRIYPSEALITVAGRRSKAMADQLTTAARSRVGSLLDSLAPEDLLQVERAIRLQLGLDE